MKFEKTQVFNFDGALRGMRNPLESWKKSDSQWGCESCTPNDVDEFYYVIGENDMKLAQRLIKAGSEHRKFMRQIFVSVDITAPLYFWKEFDTYKVGTVANSTSTMHKIASTPITMDCFEPIKNMDLETKEECSIYSMFAVIICYCEQLRQNYLETKNKDYWKALIQLLPESWLQTRTVTMNYENILNMVHQRKNHKLTEWSVDFINWAKALPYADELIFIDIPDVYTFKKGLVEINEMIESMIGACGELADKKCYEIQNKIKELMEK